MRFYTLFPECENVHLIKDVGMIPYILHKEHNADAYIVSYDLGDYPYLHDEVKGLKHVILKKITKNKYLDSLLFVLLNFRKIDTLQLYHFNLFNVLILYVFSSLNFFRETKTYLKLDADDGILELRLRGFLGFCFKILIKNIDVISVETKYLYEQLIKRDYFSKNLIYLPNGFYARREEIIQKEKIILTVGRIGTFQKNTELLIDAFKSSFLVLKDWKLIIIGPIETKEKDFQLYIDNLFFKNPELKEFIIFTGPIYDRKLLNSYYDKSRIFCLTSRFESFGLVYLEALQAGCSIISSTITPAYDIVVDRNIGILFDNDNVVDLIEKIQLLAQEDFSIKTSVNIQDFAYQNFYWPTIINKLKKELS